jgi:hypothetical protein
MWHRPSEQFLNTIPEQDDLSHEIKRWPCCRELQDSREIRELSKAPHTAGRQGVRDILGQPIKAFP